VRQYELWWADLPEPVGRRPVLLLTRTPAYRYLNQVIVVEITTRVRGIPQEVPLGRSEGLGHPSVARFDSLQTVPKRTLHDRIGVVAPRRVREIKRALGFALDWPELTVI
jgi:mRNA interferase MazF